MDRTDRENLVSRHFEQLSTAEAAHVLGMSTGGGLAAVPEPSSILQACLFGIAMGVVRPRRPTASRGNVSRRLIGWFGHTRCEGAC